MKEIDQLRAELKETEKKLCTIPGEQAQSSEITARSILDQATDMTIVCDEYGRVSLASEGTHRYIGGNFLLSPFDEIVKLRFSSPNPLRNKDFSVSNVLSGNIFRREEVILQRDGEGFHFLLSARPLTNRHGRIYGCVVTLTDITERKQMEAELTRLASFPQLNPNPVVEVDRAGHVEYSNSAAERLFPDLKKAGLNHPWLMDLEKISETLKTGVIETYVRELRVGDRWYQQTIHSVMEGTRLRIYCFDITERKRAEEESERLRVEAENERYRLEAMMEALPVGVSITDPQGAHIRSNHTFEQIWGSPRPTTVSVSDYAAYKAWWEETGKPVKPEEWASARAVQKKETVVGQLMQIERFDGTRGFVLNSAAPILDGHGQIIGSAVAIQDISANREAEMKYSKILATTLSGFWITDVQGKLLEVNDALCRMLGYTRKELLTLSIADVEADENPANVQNHILALRQKQSDCFVSRHRRKDGSIIDVEVNSTWLDIGEGQLVGFMQDITERKQMEEELRKSRDELEVRVQERTKKAREQSRVLDFFFKFSITPFVILDRDFNFIRVNEAYANACHRAVSEFPGHNHFEFYPSDAKVKFDQVVQTKKPYLAAARPFSFPDHPEWGTSYWDWTLTPILDDTGEVEYLVFSLEDVTKRKQADEAIKRERQRFYDVLEMLPAYLVLLTPDYHVPFANRFFRERFGESHGNRCFEYLFNRSEPCEICETYTVLKTIAPHHWEWTGPDGRIYDVSDFPFTDTDGSVSVLEMGIDITERKRAEEALRAAHQYNRSLIEASLDPLLTINSEGKVTDVNSATELATGVTREQLIGSDFSNYFADPDKAREGYQTAFLKGTARDYPLAIRHRSGMITDVLYNATIYRNEAGEIQGVFAAARDITERKRAEEALKESEVRLRALSSQLLTAQESERKRIALELHDGIGQMLTAIKFKVENTVQEMGKGKVGAKGKSLEAIIPMIKETIEEVRRMQMDLRPSTLDDLGVLATLGWFCREYQRIYSRIRIEKEISLEESEVSIPLKVVLYRLTQEAMNNIAKHSQADLVRLSLKKQENKIEWSIEDNGMGFDLEYVLSSERSKRGLGLGSMKERAELSGGTFAIESTQGKGTTVRASWTL